MPLMCGNAASISSLDGPDNLAECASSSSTTFAGVPMVFTVQLINLFVRAPPFPGLVFVWQLNCLVTEILSRVDAIRLVFYKSVRDIGMALHGSFTALLNFVRGQRCHVLRHVNTRPYQHGFPNGWFINIPIEIPRPVWFKSYLVYLLARGAKKMNQSILPACCKFYPCHDYIPPLQRHTESKLMGTRPLCSSYAKYVCCAFVIFKFI
jgi:hypothetical protein